MGVRPPWLAGLACVALAQAGCSGDDDSAGTQKDPNQNVTFAASCPASPCGGDPTGHWTFASGCVTPPPEGFDCATALSSGHGETHGTISFTGSGYSMELDSTLQQCGWVDDSGESAGGSVTVMGTSLTLGVRIVDFCVDGDVLTLSDQTVTYPDLSTLVFHRDP